MLLITASAFWIGQEGRLILALENVVLISIRYRVVADEEGSSWKVFKDRIVFVEGFWLELLGFDGGSGLSWYFVDILIRGDEILRKLVYLCFLCQMILYMYSIWNEKQLVIRI